MIQVLVSLREQLSPDQQRGMMAVALEKLAPHMLKDLRRVPEDQLAEGMRGIGHAILAACDGGDAWDKKDEAVKAIAGNLLA